MLSKPNSRLKLQRSETEKTFKLEIWKRTFSFFFLFPLSAAANAETWIACEMLEKILAQNDTFSKCW